MSTPQFTDDDRFDGLYLQVAQTTRGIEPLLDTVFSFLRRRTDFFAGPPGTDPNAPGEGSAAAVAKVRQVLDKHVRLYEEDRQRQQQKQQQLETGKSGNKAKKGEEDNVIEIGADGFDASAAAADEAKPKAAASAAAVAKPSAPKAKKDAAPAPAPEPAISTAGTSSKTDDTDRDDGGEEESKDGPPPVGNGGTVPGKYVWTQTLQEVNIVVPLRQPTRGRDLDVVIAMSHLRIGLKADVARAREAKAAAAANDDVDDDGYIVNAPLTKPVIVDDSFWTVEDGTRLVVNLQKLNQMEWWRGVCDGDAAIDITRIQPENSNLGDLDGETRQTVEKMMFDQRQKALGLPTADEQKKLDILEQFQKQHPEMDFSNAKIT